MATRIALTHRTDYRYDRSVILNPHTIRLRPAAHTRTTILSYALHVEPKKQFLNWQQDPYGNHYARVVFPDPSNHLSITVDLVAELTPINPFDFFIEAECEQFPFSYSKSQERELAPYLETLPTSDALQQVIDSVRGKEMRTVDFLVELNQAIYSRVAYLVRMEPGVQTPEETLTKASGSCRDSSWLLVQLCRNLGLAARFCSGYLIQLVADEKALDGPEGTKVDFTDLHAWAEVYVPGAGWIGLDPTSGLLTAEGHIPLACTAEPANAAPITGTIGKPLTDTEPVKPEFSFHMEVKRIIDRPRITQPLDAEQWNAVNRLGERIDADLSDMDVRLTMGGEPTFVSIDDREDFEWNTAALGPHKRRQGLELFYKLRERFGKGGLPHFGQSKWYPGEASPRWALGCYWRTDGQPIWHNVELIADESKASDYTSNDAKTFIHTLTNKLNIDAGFIIPGYEDTLYYLWRERQLPKNIAPGESDLGTPEERERLARVFAQGLGEVVGYTLPLRHSTVSGWQSGKWPFRGEHLHLLTGDSPMGFRLPLDTIPWEEPEERAFDEPVDPFAKREPLPGRIQPQTVRPQPSAKPKVVRTAMCVEVRDGKLFVFMPPLRSLEAYLELISAIESTASELSIPITLEGYKPPGDPRIQSFQITPDPGVLEVNLQPTDNWHDLSDITLSLYEDARQCRLTAAKFMLDGKQTGTGGGNHIVLGGPSAGDSPFLRRPDLLQSLIRFWNNHPALSYLFSGLFIGPTSQHPRIDEARHDCLYEVELACRQAVKQGNPPPAWHVDRLFRNLLIDVTGNTHRAEFCIDKLYSPDSNEGRRGLLELRCFEMPPHAQMSCVLQLLIRGLAAAFWNKPYTKQLVRWGTTLHDRFMLPHYVETDLHDLLDELHQISDYNFDPKWFAAQVEFRFPLLGSVTHGNVHLELRQGLEPWPTLGEEPGGGGAVRTVDSTLERLQVRIEGLTDDRYVVTCNGQPLPLQGTGKNGEYIAGVRYRAWTSPLSLHPEIPVHTPLIFDIVDTWNNRSLGGCTYHVAHPGGRAFDTFPVNAREAESRRISRFVPFGHTAGKVDVPEMERSAEFPHTLDLRWYSDRGQRD